MVPDAPTATLGRRVLVVGPARSGKSHWAEERLSAERSVDYVATSEVPHDDDEWAERVRIHQARRPQHWRTIETVDLVELLERSEAAPLLVDCLAVWLARVMDAADVWSDAPGSVDRVHAVMDALVQAVSSTARRVIFVSNEVGAGLVPEGLGSRRYRDLLGTLNARVGAACDEIWLCQVGVAHRWK